MEADKFKNHISTLHETHLEQLAELLYQWVLKSDLLELNQGFSTSKIAKKSYSSYRCFRRKIKNLFYETLGDESGFGRF